MEASLLSKLGQQNQSADIPRFGAIVNFLQSNFSADSN